MSDQRLWYGDLIRTPNEAHLVVMCLYVEAGGGNEPSYYRCLRPNGSSNWIRLLEGSYEILGHDRKDLICAWLALSHDVDWALPNARETQPPIEDGPPQF